MTLTNEQIVELATKITRTFLGEIGEGGLSPELWMRARTRAAIEIGVALYAARDLKERGPAHVNELVDGLIGALDRMTRS